MTSTDPELPDADEAPTAEDLDPGEAPVPAHGEMASQEQLDEGERAVELAEDTE